MKLKCKDCMFCEESKPIKNLSGRIIDAGLGNCSIKKVAVIINDEACGDIIERIAIKKKSK